MYLGSSRMDVIKCSFMYLGIQTERLYPVAFTGTPLRIGAASSDELVSAVTGTDFGDFLCGISSQLDIVFSDAL